MMIARTIIIGAGASVSYGMPLAGGLVSFARQEISTMLNRARELKFGWNEYDIAKGDDLKLAILGAIVPPLSLEKVADSLRLHLVQQNLDDFVRDHPSMTSIVSRLIAAKLFSSFYLAHEGMWELRNNFMPGRIAPDKDWMRLFVGIERRLSLSSRLKIVSFNYDAILERAMRLYWPHSETKYPEIDEAVEFIYPHGRFSSLPQRVASPRKFIEEQSANLKLGDNIDEAARAKAKAAVAQARKVYSVGFSFGDTNVELLGLSELERRDHIFVQTYKNEDKRLLRTLRRMNVLGEQHDDADADRLVVNGFFEQ